MCLYPIKITACPKDGEPHRATVCCGRCMECVRQKSVEWAFRIMHEAAQYKSNCFLTLTYNNENLPSNGVERREVQLFIKRLRKALSPQKLRFFACGEYGKKFGRPHYHLIIFGWYPDDTFYHGMDGKTKLYRSPLLERVWQKGFSSVAKVEYETALYCAKYMNKWQYDILVRRKANDRDFIKPNKPFVQMSNRPGVGYNAVYRCDLNTDKIYINGKSTKIPRYYLKVMERDGLYLEDFKERRMQTGAMKEKTIDLEEKRKKFYERFNSAVVKPH